MPNPLTNWLRAADPLERTELAQRADTSVSYLYQLCGAEQNRRRPNVVLAVKLEAGTRAMRAKNRKLPLVTVIDLARLFE